jgi:hypothetical protein
MNSTSIERVPVPAVMADDEMLQDFLLDMDFDELIPVDNFFDSYVGALSREVSSAGVLRV